MCLNENLESNAGDAIDDGLCDTDFFLSSLNVNCAAHLFELLHVKQEGVVKDFFKTIFNILKSIFTRFFLKRNFLKISIVAHPTNFQNTF